MQTTHDSSTGNSSFSTSRSHLGRHNEDMKGAIFVVNHNLRTIARSIATLAKISEDVHIEVTDAGLFFKVAHRSKYCVFRFAPEFFNSCDVSMINNKHVNICRLSMKTAQRIFKGVTVNEKNFVECQFRIDPKAEKMVVNLRMNHDINRTVHAKLREMSNVLQKPVYDRASCKNTTVISASALTPILAQMKNDVEVTFKVDQNGITIRNFHSAYGFTMFNGSELKGGGKKVKTETTIGINNLTRHTATVCSEFSFSFREFLAIVQFAEQLTSEICMSYDVPGRPLIVTIETHPNFDVELALPTMGNDEEVDLDGGIVTETLARVDATDKDIEITHISSTNLRLTQSKSKKKPTPPSIIDELDIVSSSSGSQPKRGPSNSQSKKKPSRSKANDYPDIIHWNTTVPVVDKSWRANEVVEEPVRVESPQEVMEVEEVVQRNTEQMEVEDIFQAPNMNDIMKDFSIRPERIVEDFPQEEIFVDDNRNEQNFQEDDEHIFRAPEPKKQKNAENRNKEMRRLLLGTTRKEATRMEDFFSGSPLARDTQF